MTPSKTERPNEGRLPYEKPVLRTISLAVEQVLGTPCKAQNSNPSTNLLGQQLGCITGNCKIEIGS